MQSNLEKKYKPLIIIISIVVPLVVAGLFTIKIDGINLSFLPPIYASLNASTSILLIFAVISIKTGNQERHKKLMTSAVICSLLFLVGYISYHITSSSTIYGDINHDGIRDDSELKLINSSYGIYAFILLSHILLSIVVIPLVMMTYLKGWAGNVSSHKKWAKITFPIWLYVAISGVIVYLMISPYYT